MGDWWVIFLGCLLGLVFPSARGSVQYLIRTEKLAGKGWTRSPHPAPWLLTLCAAGQGLEIPTYGLLHSQYLSPTWNSTPGPQVPLRKAEDTSTATRFSTVSLPMIKECPHSPFGRVWSPSIFESCLTILFLSTVSVILGCNAWETGSRLECTPFIFWKWDEGVVPDLELNDTAAVWIGWEWSLFSWLLWANEIGEKA